MILLAGLVVILVLTLYFEFKYMRPKRRDDIESVLTQDDAYNAIASTNAVSASLKGMGKETHEADALMVKAQMEFQRKDYPRAIATAKVAKDILINAKERAFIDDTPALLESEKAVAEKPEEEKTEEDKTVHEVKKLPPNYLESKFLISTTHEEVENARSSDRDVSQAEKYLCEADTCFEEKDYPAALRSCMKARRCLAGKPVDGAGSSRTLVADLSTPELTQEVGEVDEKATPEPRSTIVAPSVREEMCPKCNATMKDDDNFCPKCGHKVEMVTRCRKCQSPVAGDDAFCRKCGERLG